MQSLKALFLFAILWIATSCGPSATNPRPVINSFTATPSSLPASGGNVTLAWDVSGATSLTIDNDVGDVTGLTSKVVNNVIASKTFQLTATNSAGPTTATASVSVPANVTLAGKVIYQGANIGVASAKVLVLGKPPVTSENNGNFTVTAVSTPYDIVISDSNNRATIYRGLTRADPTLVLYGVTTMARNASATGTVRIASTGTPVGAGRLVQYASASGGTGSANTNASGVYNMTNISWYGQAVDIGTLFAVDSFGMNPTYFGRKDSVTLMNGMATTGQDIGLNPFTPITLSGTFSVPTGYALTQKRGGFSIIPRGGVTGPPVSGSALPFSFTLPVIPQGDTFVDAQATRASETIRLRRGGFTMTQSGINLALQEAPHLQTPADSAVNVSTVTQFSWTGFTGGIHILRVIPVTPTNPTYNIISTRLTETIPDLAAISLSLPSMSSYHWQVLGYAPIASMDVATNGITLLSFLESFLDYAFGDSGTRTITTR